MTALAVQLDTQIVTTRFAAALRAAFGETKAAAKNVARAANSNLRAAENWLAGRNAPDAVHMLRLMATVPEFAAEVRKLTGMASDMDPEFERDLSRLFTQWQRVRAAE